MATTPKRRRGGFTLLELIVVLALMGLAMAVVAPSLVLRPPSPDESVQRVVASARRVAMRRAQTVTLDIDAGGAWRLAAAERNAGEVMLSGELDERPLRDVHLRITPLGLCLTEQRDTGNGQRATGNGQRGTGNGADSAAGRRLVFDPLTCSSGDRQAGTR